MAGLVGYGSSDEDEETTTNIDGSSQVVKTLVAQPVAAPVKPVEVHRQESAPISQRSIPDALEGPLAGPSLGPVANGVRSGLQSREQSPSTEYRELVQNLTLPSVPNFEIPPSPSGSPPPGTDTKIRQFAKLKKQGMHFNEKLASSSALKNPSLLNKLIANAGLSEDQQYANSLPSDLSSMTRLEDWMYKENLEQARQAAERLKYEAAAGRPRSAVDFVPAKSG